MLQKVFSRSAPACRCQPRFSQDRLIVSAESCPGHGDLVEATACRSTVIDALRDRSVSAVCTQAAGLERAYEDRAARALSGAGAFVESVSFYDADLADRARTDPLGAARIALNREDPLPTLVDTTGLKPVTAAPDSIAFRPAVGPTLARSRVHLDPPRGATLRDSYELDTGATVRLYDGTDPPTYHLIPIEHTLEQSATRTLEAAYRKLASGAIAGGERAPGRAVRAVADTDVPIQPLTAVLRKHTHGLGIFEDCFADPAITDAFVSAPVRDNVIRVHCGGMTYQTNVRLTEQGAASLASRFRRASGRAFSRANPTLDAAVRVDSRRIRVAGVTEPVSNGLGFALRAHDEAAFRLIDLVDNGTVPPSAAGLLSVAVKRGAAILLAGPRSAGKTTMLGALLWELPPATRLIVIEDTPELPVGALQEADRDVQPLLVDTADGASISPRAALQTALRLGDGALVIGEVRGEEARVLYEAMRVGAADDAVLGTIHGDGAETVRERVVTDLGVPVTAFADTDLVVTLAAMETPTGRNRRLTRIESVKRTNTGVDFAIVHDGTAVCDSAYDTVYENLTEFRESPDSIAVAVEEATASFRT